jgi:hypothetical protein
MRRRHKIADGTLYTGVVYEIDEERVSMRTTTVQRFLRSMNS